MTHFSTFGIDAALCRRVLSVALGRGADDADLYFEHSGSTSVALSDGKVNRATSATLTFSDGATQTVEIKDTRLPTTIAISPHQTSSVKLTFSGVVKGTSFNDICVTDVTFSK